jgi:hypothetical protein
MEQADVYRFQKEFVEASVELQEETFTDFIKYRLEDSTEDISHWVVSQGKEFYLKVWNNPETIPAEIEENSTEILYGIAAEIYREKFGSLIGIYG